MNPLEQIYDQWLVQWHDDTAAALDAAIAGLLTGPTPFMNYQVDGLPELGGKVRMKRAKQRGKKRGQVIDAIYVGPNAQQAMQAIGSAQGPLRVVFNVDACDGSVFDLLAVHNALRRREQPTVAEIRGVSTLLGPCGAGRIAIERGSYVLIRPLTAATAGTPDEMRAAADTLDRVTAQVARVFAERRPAAEALMLDGQEHLIDAEEALRLGLVDEVVS